MFGAHRLALEAGHGQGLAYQRGGITHRVGRGLVCGQGAGDQIGVGQHRTCAQVAGCDDDVNGVLRLGPEGQEDEGEGEEAEDGGEKERFLAHGEGSVEILLRFDGDWRQTSFLYEPILTFYV